MTGETEIATDADAAAGEEMVNDTCGSESVAELDINWSATGTIGLGPGSRVGKPIDRKV
jgi:hypothetical protein